MSRIFIASDHSGYGLKEYLMTKKDLGLINVGPHLNEIVDYPVYSKLVCDNMKVEMDRGNNDVMGVLVGGSGIGMSISANRNKWIRAALCCDRIFSELSRQHNNANVVVLPGQFIPNDMAYKIVRTFMDTRYDRANNERCLSLIDE